MLPASRRGLGLAAAVLAAVLSSSVAEAQTTALHLVSQTGDYIGQGRTQTWTSTDLLFTAQTTGGTRTGVVINARTSDFSTYWRLQFIAPDGAELDAGTYESAFRAIFSSRALPQLDVTGQSRGCNTLSGRFVVYEFALDAGGAVSRFAADFEQHCEGATPALFGAVRFNSTRSSLVPFDGVYPVFSLQVEPALNGYVTGPGIDCGAGRVTCAEEYAPNSLVALQAFPSPGYVFLGWAGDCVGNLSAAVTSSRRRFCAPVFNGAPASGAPESPDFSHGALFLNGDIGLTRTPQHTWKVYLATPPRSPFRSTVKPARYLPSSRGQVALTVDGPDATIDLFFSSPAGTELVPGTEYRYTSTSWEAALVPRLRIGSTGALGCAAGGRFTVHEYEFDEGEIVRFAADFQVPCGPSSEPVTGSIRYRSGRASLLPFDGDYPLFQLGVHASLGGAITGPGIDCGDGARTDCEQTYTSPATVSLQATPSSGYRFVAWSGSCSGGNPTASVTVERAERCFAIFEPVPSGGAPADPWLAKATLFVQDLSGRLVPARRILVGDDGRVSATRSPSLVHVTFAASDSEAYTTVSFTGRNGPLQPGDYEAEHPPWSGFALSPDCHVNVARFRIYELSVGPDGRLLSFSADFEARCNSFLMPHVVGAVRFNSARADIVPFGGAYPIHKLIVEPSVNGIVTGPGIDCGPGRGDCTEILAAPATVPLQATPLPGYKFVGWGGACSGAAASSVAISWIHSCAAVFNAVVPGSGTEDPRVRDRALMTDSELGEPVGLGRRFAWLDASIDVFPWSRSRLSVQVAHPNQMRWSIELQAPSGRDLQRGTYDGAVELWRASTSPGISIRSGAAQCSSSTGIAGRFVIHEIAFASAASATVTALAADFEQQCTPGGPRLRGSIRFHSRRSVLTPFAPDVFIPAPSPSRTDFDGNGWPDLVWRHSGTGRNAIWLMDGVNARVTAVLAPSSAGAVTDMNWEIRATGDMNGDERADLIWQHAATGRIAVWFMSGTTRTGTHYLFDSAQNSHEPDLDWKIVAAGDMNRDGHTDLVWRHAASGAIRIWHMTGNVQWDSVAVGTVADTDWEIAGVADMSRDGMPDLVWRHASTGKLAAWFMHDAVVQATPRLSPAELADTNWRIVGVADMNRDQKPDLVWQHTTTGELGVWFLDGVTQIGGRYLNPPRVSDPAWRIVGVR